jgi:hypothetical protein
MHQFRWLRAAHVTRRLSGAVSVWVLAAALVAAAPGGAAAQSIDNKGTEFFVTFLPNYYDGQIELHLTSAVATSVTVEYPINAPTFSNNYSLTPGAITIVSLPTTAASSWPVDTVSNNAARISASDDVVAYMINRASATSDASVALPIDTFNTEYIVASYAGLFSNDSEFSVVAAYDDTEVTITPSQAMAGGHAAGIPFTVVLDRGEAYFGHATTTGSAGDLTGTQISATRPVGMTNGNRCTNVPSGYYACDHIFEVAPPVQTWGLDVLVANLPNRAGGSVYRALASTDGTAITLDGVAQGTINRGQFLEIGPLAGDHLISGSAPILVVQYMTGQGYPGSTLGDPAMGNMSPAAQFLTGYTFSTVGGGQFVENYVTLIAADADVATLLLDGAPLPGGSFTAIGTTGYSAARVLLAEGTHTTSSANPHGLSLEGYNGFDSYLYAGGALFQFINPSGDANPPLCEVELLAGPPRYVVGTAQDARPSEDVNGNHILDEGEDLNGNELIDDDTGIFFVQLAPGAVNLTLTVDPFTPADPSASFRVDAIDQGLPASGTVVVTDGAGNTCQADVTLGSPCGAAPAAGCRSAGKSKLLIKGGSKRKFLWKWLNGEATDVADFAQPTTTTNYSLCIYAGTTTAIIDLPAGSSWSSAGQGFKYKDKAGVSDGAQKASLKAGAAGKTKAMVKGKGPNLPTALIPPLGTPLTVQLVNDANDVCFESVYTAVTTNDAKQVKARTP